MVRRQLRIYYGPDDTRSIALDHLEPAKRTARISLEELLTTLQDAAHEKKSWIDDFHDEEVTISTDLYEVILAYQHYRRPSA